MSDVQGTRGLAQSWVRAANSSRSSYGFGTLGAVLRPLQDPGLLGLTAGHVLGGDERARIGDPCRLHAWNCASVDGRLHDWKPWFGENDPQVDVDAGLVALAPQAVEPLVKELPWPTGWADARPGDRLTLLTRHHRLPAELRAVQDVPMQTVPGQCRYVIAQAWILQVEGGGCLPGDSGAAVWNERDELVALHSGEAPPGSPGNAVATPILRVLEWARARPLLRGDALAAEERDATSLPPAPPPEPALHDAQAAALGDQAEQALALDTLARTMWGEARGEPDARAGMGAVAHVVINRVAARSWWGRDVTAVCRKHAQFSCWNAGDPNLPQLRAVTTADASFRLALEVARELLALEARDPRERARIDPTGGATHYLARSLGQWPEWARGQPVNVAIGNHLFFRNVA